MQWARLEASASTGQLMLSARHGKNAKRKNLGDGGTDPRKIVHDGMCPGCLWGGAPGIPQIRNLRTPIGYGGYCVLLTHLFTFV